jgi:hypothetical protein
MEKLRPVAITSMLFAGLPAAMSVLPLLVR